VSLARLLVSGAALLLAGACIRISPMIPDWPKAVVPQGALTLAPESHHIIEAQINGHEVRLRVDPGYEGIILNRDVAERIGLQRSIGRMTCWSGRCGWRGRRRCAGHDRRRDRHKAHHLVRQERHNRSRRHRQHGALCRTKM
jgi:hypothetical protein